MAAADSFIGDGLSDSPYAEMERRAVEAERACNVERTKVDALKSSLRERSVQYLSEKMRANNAERRIENLERDIEWLRDLVTKLAEG